MFPYFSITQISFGPITIQVWGLLVAVGFLFGAVASAGLAKKRGLKANVVWDILGWLLLGAIIGARLFFVFFYAPQIFIQHPWEILYLWQGGMSMIGGIFGATLLAVWFLRRRRLDFWQYTEILVFGLPLGYFIGRLGCFLIHDHPGIPTTFFLGVRYPDGIIRHDLALYHFLFGLFLFLFFLFLEKMKKSQKNFAPSFLIIYLIFYGLARFFLDFLRVGEVRLLFLTPGQYFGIILLIIGLLLFCLKKMGKIMKILETK